LVASVLGERVAQAWGEGKRSGGRCGETRWRCSPFIGGWGSTGEFNAGINGFNAIEDGEGLRGDLRENEGEVVTVRWHSRCGAGRRSVAEERWRRE
jgi:hypothetical protein